MTLKRKIIISDLRVLAHIGIHSYEKNIAQPILIDIELAMITAPTEDSLENTICYDKLAQKIEKTALTHFNLAETLAEAIAANCLDNLSALWVMVRVKKTAALKNATYAGVEIIRHKS